MVQFLKRWFRPSRFDACCFVIAIQWMVVLFSVAILPSMPNGHVPIESGMAILVAFGTLIAIAATQCWKSNSNRRTLMLVVSSIASVGCVVGWYYFNSGYVDAKRSVQFGLQTAELPSFDVAGFLWGTSVFLRNSLAAACFVWLINLAICRLSRSAKSPLARMIERIRADRTGMLMGLAAVMFLLAIVSRLLTSSDSRTSIGPVGAVAAALGYGAAWLIMLFWFPRSFVLRGLPIQKVVSLLLLVAMCLMFFEQIMGVSSTGNRVIVLIAVVAFAFTVVGIGGVQTDVEEQPVANERFVGSRASLVSIIPVGLLLVAIGFASFYDVGAIDFSSRNVALADQLANARESSAVTRESGGRVTLSSIPSQRDVVWRVQFDESAPKDLVSFAIGRNVGQSVELCDLTPEFETGVLNGSGMSVRLADCEVSHSQLSDILSSSSWISIRGKFSIVDDGTEVDSGMVNGIQFEGVEPGVVRQFFSVAKCESQMNYTVINSAVGREDWPVVEELAQSGSVYLYGGWADGFQLPTETRSLRRIHFQDLSDPRGKPKPVDKNLVFNTDMKLTFAGSTGSDPAIAWKLMLLRGDFGGYPLEHYWNLSNSPIDEFAKEIGLSYQLNADQTIHSIYLPLCSGIQLEGLDEVRVLSFDPAWVEGASIGSGRGVPTSLSSLNSLTNLEELYFEIGFVPEDLSFLNHLTSLKHLQIPSVLRKVTGPIGFDACQTLESITFFGKPDNTTYREIIRLENLKRLVIVNSENDSSLNDQYLMKLRKKFAGVDADIILPSETESLVPKPFREFRARIRKELREDTSWLDEILEK